MGAQTLEHLFLNARVPSNYSLQGSWILGEETSLFEEDEGKWFVEAKENVRW